jgi:hypothetical protein
MKQVILFLLATMVSLFFIGCDNASEDNATTKKMGDTIQIGYGETYLDKENGYSIKFTKAEDGRCPANADCFWEGNAKVYLDLVTAEKQHHSFSLNTYRAFTTDTIIENLSFKLLSLTPYPGISEQVVKQTDYTIKLVAKKI